MSRRSYMMKLQYHIPNLNKRTFARTNVQTIAQRAALLQELLPGVKTIAELCCGDCARQATAYRQQLGVETYHGLDIHPEIVAANRAQGIDCIWGDVMDANTLRQFTSYEVIFFGPPLSIECDGHRLLTFREVTPRYGDFVQLLLGELDYKGTLICICPNTTTSGDIRWLYHQIKSIRDDFGLRLAYYSYASVTGENIETELRLKYVDLWFSNRLENHWEIRDER